MMIGIDASRANKPIKTGVEWYAFHLIQELKKQTANDGNTWVLYTREPLSDDLADLPSNWYEVRAKWPPKRLWTQVRMSWEMMRRPADVLFVPAHVLPPISPEKSVVTVHDVGFRRMPELYRGVDKQYHEMTTRTIAKTNARIITVSEFSGREIVDLYHIDPRRIAITHLGIDHDVYRVIQDEELINRTLAKHKVPEPYFFYIGRIEKKKNVLNLIKAFDAYKERRGLGDPMHLVLAGPDGHGIKEIQAAINASKYRDSIVKLGYLPEVDVPILLNGATAYLQVTWYEGFGIPPVQAMACGTPVIASDNSSLPEVLGEGNALFVPPDEINVIARAMERTVDDQQLVASLKTKGLAHVQRYQWSATAQQTIPVLTDWLGG